MKRLSLMALAVAGVVFIAPRAEAAVTFEFTSIVEGAPAGGPMYARLTITNAGTDTVSLFLENTAAMPQATGQAIHYLMLNVDPFITDLNVTSADSKFEGFTKSENGQNDAGSKFDLQLNFDIAPPSDRFLPGDSAMMTATGTGLTEDSFDAMSGGVPREALLHVISIPVTGESAKITTGEPVPEPATMAALGLGLVAFIKRRRRA